MRLAWLLLVTACYQDVTLRDAAVTVGPDGALSAYELAVLSDKPSSYWPMDDAAGPTLRDLAGTSPGTATGTCEFGVIDHLFSPAVNFQAEQCVVDIGNGFAFEGNKPFTIEAWVDYDAAETHPFREVIAHEDRPAGTPTDGWGLVFPAPNAIQFERVVDSGSAATQPAAIPFGPHAVVVTYDGAKLQLYLDASAATATTDTRPAMLPAADALIGAAGSQSHFEGVIGQVAIYDQALPPGRIAAHLQAAGAATQPLGRP